MVLAAHPEPQPQIVEALTAYAQHLGLVFQMQDDYLDKYAPSHPWAKAALFDISPMLKPLLLPYTIKRN